MPDTTALTRPKAPEISENRSKSSIGSAMAVGLIIIVIAVAIGILFKQTYGDWKRLDIKAEKKQDASSRKDCRMECRGSHGKAKTSCRTACMNNAS
jgi:hypothetical protein